MKSNYPTLPVILTARVASLLGRVDRELSRLSLVIQRLFNHFIKFLEAVYTGSETIKAGIGEITSIFGYSARKPLMLSNTYTHFCVRKRSKLDCFLNTTPQRMLILKPNMLCKLKV